MSAAEISSPTGSTATLPPPPTAAELMQSHAHIVNSPQFSVDSGFDANESHGRSVNASSLASPSQTGLIPQFQVNGYSASMLSSAQQFSATRDKCFRCNNQVYALERIGPVKGNIYHKICFKCLKCDRQLDLKTYYTNQINLEDRQIYCQSHAPKSGKGVFGADNMLIRSILNGPRLDSMQKFDNKPKATIDGNAKHIVHASNAQKLLQNGHKRIELNQSNYHYPVYPVKAKEEIRKAQQQLEAKQRAEEDMLLQKFREERAREEERLEKEVKEEWEKRLKHIQSQYKGGGASKDLKTRLEQEEKDLEKNMTMKRRKKAEDTKRALLQLEQEATANLVTKHSKEMIDLLNAKQSEVISTEAITGAARPPLKSATPPPPQPPVRRKRDLYDDPSIFELIDQQAINVAESEQTSYTELIDLLTHGLVTDLEKARAIFRWITVKDLNAIEFGDSLNTDSPLGLLRGIKYGTETYHTLFMRLCSYAGLHCVDVKGHSKSVGYEPGMKIQPGKFTNTWNAVLIDDEWRFVQCNWGARHLVMSKDSKKAVPEATVPNTSTAKPSRDKIKYQYDEHYFLPDPEEFILEFYPHNAEWQLLETPITLDEFESLPFVRSLFFHYHLDFVNQRQAVIVTNSRGACDIKLRMPEDLKTRLAFHFHLRLANREENEINGVKLERYVLHTIQDDLVSFNVHVPHVGEYFVEIFSSLVESEQNPFGQSFKLKCVCKYKIVCEELTQRMHPLPACASGEWGPMKALRHFNIQPLTHASAIIETASAQIEMQFELPKLLKIHGKLHNNSLSDLDRFIRHETRDARMLVMWVTLPDEGQFGLDIYARDPECQTEKRTMSHCCKYLINYNKAAAKPPTPPQSQMQPLGSHSEARNGGGVEQMIAIGPNREQLVKVGMQPLSNIEPFLRISAAVPQVDIQFKMSKAVDFSFDLRYDQVGMANVISPTNVVAKSAFVPLKSSEYVKVKQYGYTISFMLSLPLNKFGVYLFTVYASDDPNKSRSLPPVYTYLIRYEKSS